jgi:hypothetical protein
LGWIPSRYQESIEPEQGDRKHFVHEIELGLPLPDITITLRFVRSKEDPRLDLPEDSGNDASNVVSDTSSESSVEIDETYNQIIDTQAPLVLSSSDTILVPDLMAVHLVRVREPNTSANNPDEPPSPSSPSSGGSSTMISFHPPTRHMTTPAESLHKRLALVGRSVYWSHIFAEFSDPTFVLLALMWYPLYAWDEAFELLYLHLSNLVGFIFSFWRPFI